MDNPAGLPDLLSRGYSGQNAIGQVRLDEAWRALLLEVPSIPTSVTAGRLDSLAVADVVAGAAMRVLRNEEGVEEESGGVDDYREARKYADSSLDVYFTAAEIRRMNATQVQTSGSIKYC